MSIKKIIVFPEVISITIDKGNVISVTQEHNNADDIKAHIQTQIKTVRRYNEMGYYNLAKPEFVSEVITTFSNLELSKKDVIRVNNFIKIQGLPECNRIWQLPDEIKVQVSQMLHNFCITYDSDHWEDFFVSLA